MTITFTRRALLLLAAPFILAISQPALGQDDSLYPQGASPDAAFLRVISDDDHVTMIGDTRIEAGAAPYIEVAPGPVTVRYEGRETEVEAQANTHYTLLVSGENSVLLTDAVTGSPTNADLFLYNMSDLAAFELAVPAASAVALRDVAPMSSQSVALKAPVTFGFAVQSGGQTLAEIPEVSLLRGTGTSLVLTGAAPDIHARIFANTYE